jgi:hypothetical protein
MSAVGESSVRVPALRVSAGGLSDLGVSAGGLSDLGVSVGIALGGCAGIALGGCAGIAPGGCAGIAPGGSAGIAAAAVVCSRGLLGSSPLRAAQIVFDGRHLRCEAYRSAGAT